MDIFGLGRTEIVQKRQYNHFAFSIFNSSIYTSSLARNITVYTPSKGANKEKYYHN